eukprot:6206299-Pleurochrysis_carterae.AAC.6
MQQTQFFLTYSTICCILRILISYMLTKHSIVLAWNGQQGRFKLFENQCSGARYLNVLEAQGLTFQDICDVFGTANSAEIYGQIR